jgi:hypothetical protein
VSERKLLWVVLLFGLVAIPYALVQGLDEPLSLRILNTGITFVVVASLLLIVRHKKHKSAEKPE